MISEKYPQWLEQLAILKHESGAKPYLLSGETYVDDDDATYSFDNGFTITNSRSKAWAEGQNYTVKYSAGIPYTITIPEGVEVTTVRFYGYDNYDTEAYLGTLNDRKFTPADYPFPAKDGTTPVYVTHTIDTADAPLTGSLTFSVAVKQCCLKIILFGNGEPAGTEAITAGNVPEVTKIIKDGQIIIATPDRTYSINGTTINQ